MSHTPTKIIVVDNVAVQSEGVMAVREALEQGGAPSWTHLLFGNPNNPNDKGNDLLRKLRNMNHSAIGTLEIIAEGNPWAIDSIDTDLAATFGNKLAEVPGISATSKIYLSGCNTGLGSDDSDAAEDEDIAQLFANASQTLVYGSVGYISGAHALRNESCTRVYENDGAFPNAQDATHSHCWRKCRPMPTEAHALLAEVHQPMVFEVLTPGQMAILIRDIHDKPFGPAPTFRVAPERVIDVKIEHGETRKIQVIANGTFLRDASTYALWRNSQGSKILTKTDRLRQYQPKPSR